LLQQEFNYIMFVQHELEYFSIYDQCKTFVILLMIQYVVYIYVYEHILLVLVKNWTTSYSITTQRPQLVGHWSWKNKMTYDDLLYKIGDFGKYQKRIYFFLCLPAISCALHKLSGVFILDKTNYRYTFSMPYNVAPIYYIHIYVLF